jgi:hypothetical protein
VFGCLVGPTLSAQHFPQEGHFNTMQLGFDRRCQNPPASTIEQTPTKSTVPTLNAKRQRNAAVAERCFRICPHRIYCFESVVNSKGCRRLPIHSHPQDCKRTHAEDTPHSSLCRPFDSITVFVLGCDVEQFKTRGLPRQTKALISSETVLNMLRNIFSLSPKK